MKNQFTLQINKPCLENYATFKPTKSGGFCNSCSKEVIDFTNMNSKEIINYFKEKKNDNTCGKFNKNQLKTYNEKLTSKSFINMISGIGFACLSFFTMGTMHAQGQVKTKIPTNKKILQEKKDLIVKGVVSDESGPLPGAAVLLQGTTIGTETDFDGNFSFPKPLHAGDVLLISFVGMESKKISITDKASSSKIHLNIKMNSDSCMLLGKIAVKKVYQSKKNK